jgi:hypothetical protein
LLLQFQGTLFEPQHIVNSKSEPMALMAPMAFLAFLGILMVLMVLMPEELTH